MFYIDFQNNYDIPNKQTVSWLEGTQGTMQEDCCWKQNERDKKIGDDQWDWQVNC